MMQRDHPAAGAVPQQYVPADRTWPMGRHHRPHRLSSGRLTASAASWWGGAVGGWLHWWSRTAIRGGNT